MRFLILGSVFCFACIGISSAWLLDNYNNNELDLDMLYFGGAIIPGKVNITVMDQTIGYCYNTHKWDVNLDWIIHFHFRKSKIQSISTSWWLLNSSRCRPILYANAFLQYWQLNRFQHLGLQRVFDLQSSELDTQ